MRKMDSSLEHACGKRVDTGKNKNAPPQSDVYSPMVARAEFESAFLP